MSSDNVALLEDCANRLRVTSIEITSKANSGHPTSSASAAEIMATLFFAEMRYDAQKPRDVNADRFVMSKGHACPVLYAAWRLSFIDVATGSLGQGLSLSAGMAVAGQKVDHASYRTYCLMGDGETAEGLAFASHNKLDNLVAIVDINRLGQSRPTQLGHDIDTYAKRFAAFGWHTISVDGHSVTELLKAYEEAKKTKGKPTVILAKTYKGNGIEGVSDNEGYHGKALPKEKLNAIRDNLKSPEPHKWNIAKPAYDVPESNLRIGSNKLSSPPNYTIGDEVATRKAYGVALVKLADQNKRVIALDAEVSNSTFSEMVAKKHPEQYVECFIAEQNMVGVGIGLGCRERAIPFCSTFAAFFTRAADQIRMAAVSFANVKFCGSHVGVSIGEDGPSQMGLEDLALFRAIPGGVVLYPSDAVSTEYAVELVANQRGIAYIRSGRPNLPVIYANDEKFQIGQSKVVRQSQNDRLLVIGAGVTLAEAIKAHDQLNREGVHVAVLDIFSVQPIDRDTILAHAQRCGGRVLTVEDHYQAGGIGEAVSAALSDQTNIQIRRIFVQELPRSGAPDALLDRYGLSAKHIAEAVKKFLN
ncbi:Transket-pyr domain-containing protein [Aphelenchoides besseyi]|nr:Transket-pyr domain-containing protein [Aphelenchoides besseyi]